MPIPGFFDNKKQDRNNTSNMFQKASTLPRNEGQSGFFSQSQAQHQQGNNLSSFSKSANTTPEFRNLGIKD